MTQERIEATRAMYANICFTFAAALPCDELWRRFPGPWSLKGWAHLYMIEDAKREDQRRSKEEARE